jgi:ligand-binding SRPBCC domain-containing protein
MHRLRSVQRFPLSLDQAWAFFSDPNNLSAITPPALGFVARYPLPHETYAGLILVYRVRPLFNIPTTWVTEITHVEPPNYFVDEQRSGPYRMWHHEHRFTEVPGGVEVEDLVHYALPFGPLGLIVERLLVRPQLHQIFNYRARVLKERFVPPPQTGTAT